MSGYRIAIIMFCLFSSLIFIENLGAQQAEFSSSLNPVGSGARATGMGGAFIGVADDATAASWNPAGLIQLEKPEVSVVYSYFHRKQVYDSKEHPEVNGEQNMDTEGLNYVSFAYPFVLLNRNMLVSVNYQRLYEMNKDYEFSFNPTVEVDSAPENGTVTQQSVGSNDFNQEGVLYTLSPAVAVQMTPDLYVGATFNLWDNNFGRNGWVIKSREVTQLTTQTEQVIDLPDPIQDMSIKLDSVVEREINKQEDNSFEGKNWHLGFLWTPVSSITIGGVYKTAFDADLVKKTTITEIDDSVTTVTISGSDPEVSDSPQEIQTESSTEKFTMRMPASYGMGLSYRHSDALTFALDMYRTEWSRFVLRDRDGDETNPLTGSPVSDGRLKDTTQVRLGAEYLFIKQKNVVPVRFGLFYDPEPAVGHLDDFYGISFGTGFARDRIALDMSYQYRFGKNVTTDFLAATDSDPDVKQHTIMTSAIFYF